MKFKGSFVAIAAAVAVLATPTVVQANPHDDAEALRKLDIMLMVTSLRCRKTADNFQPDYQRFSSAHLTQMNAAAKTLQAKLGGNSAKALDRMSVKMANDYGNGHPWLGCGELKQVTRSLTATKGHAQLASAANELLSERPRGQWAMAGGR